MYKVIYSFTLALLLTLSLVSYAFAQEEEASLEAVLPTDLEWEANPNVEGVQNASASIGDPENPGLYASFGKLDQGVVFPAHTHPDGRLTTVVSGVMYLGIGNVPEETDFQAYPAGSVIYTPAGTPHIMWAKDGEIVVQEAGFGPSGSEFVADTE